MEVILPGQLCVQFLEQFLQVAHAADCNAPASCIGRVCRKSKLFVFGDSFVDTGNLPDIGIAVTRNWHVPYGFTYPKKPAGRFSNGRCQTDYLAKMLGIPTPITYRDRRSDPRSQYGMNFAYGGAGVFPAKYRQPTLGQQVTMFQDLLQDHVFTQCDIEDSVALVAISGNDYSGIAEEYGQRDELETNVTKQLGIQLKRLSDIGVPKIIVNKMHPLGCIPFLSRMFNGDNYTECVGIGNNVAIGHNKKLDDEVLFLRADNKPNNFLILDLYQTFMSLVQQPDVNQRVFQHPMDPCCKSFDVQGSCGQVDDQGGKMYTLCTDAGAHFYWDSVHPTQSGWAAVMYLLNSVISEFLGF